MPLPILVEMEAAAAREHGWLRTLPPGDGRAADLRGRPRAWPWRSNYTEVPQLVVRVGYAPAVRPAGSSPAPVATVPSARVLGH